LFKSLRSQYFLGSLVTLVLMLVVLLWNAEQLMRRTLEERFDAELDLAAPLLGAAAASLLAERDYAGARDLLLQSANASHLVFAELLDNRGQSVARVGRPVEGDPAVRSTRQDVILAGQRLGQLHLGLDASALQASQQRLWRNSLLIGTVILMLGLALLAGWTAWVSAHLRRLTEASQSLAAGHYDQTLPTSRVQELGLLADSFNRMSAAIRDKIAALTASEQALRALNEGLESRVQQRTQELQAARDTAERASQAKSQFLSRMSHELRTPLNAILGFAQLLGMSRERLSDGEAEKVLQIERAGWHLLELIDDVLDLSRIEAGEMSTRPEALDVRALVTETTQMLASLAGQQGVQVQIDPGGSPWARADRKRLKQVLNNLLSNAIKYNRAGGRVTVTLGPAEANEVRVTVADTGRGMTPHELEQLFQPFVRFDRSAELTPGTGIGLVITRRLIELMGGRIQVSSTPDEGSVFSIWLPGCATPAAAPPLPPERRAAASTGMRPMRLLYIEDNPANAELMRSLLERHPGYILSLAADAQQGLQALRSTRPDLMLVDIDLPDLNGIEVCRHVRADPSTARLPMIALSANAMVDDIQRALDAGFDRYHTKPLDFAALLEDLAVLLNRSAPQ
jgi:signal transduction histidine kinase/ActR/RegA family two-component response regulator